MTAIPKYIAIEQMPSVRGRLRCNFPISRSTWFRVGGKAQMLFEPADTEDLAEFLYLLDASIPLTVIGAASNLLVRDGASLGLPSD